MPVSAVQVNLDLTGKRVLVVGDARRARRSVARYVASGAQVYVASELTGAAAETAFTAAVPIEVVRVAWPTSPRAWRDLVSAVDLVVAVDVPAEADTLLVDACFSRRAWLTREAAAATSATGHVTLVGGGPGYEGLMTTAGKEALRNADVVFFDRLGPRDEIAEWAPGAEHIYVGKTPGHHAVPQAEIERMLVASALAGNTVVRLKGGDPFVFGRGGEEVIACRSAGVGVTVISGVTSAIAVPAAAGIPVTHRELSRLFTVVSGHAPLSDDELAHLVGLGGTLVVLMGVTNLPHLAAGLVRHGMASDMPVAVIERGFSSGQRTTIAPISEITGVASVRGVRSPAVLVIGEVVRLSQHNDVAAVDLLQQTVSLATESLGSGA